MRFEPDRSRHLWIVNHYAALPSKGESAGRHVQLARFLENYGWTTSIIAASTTHPAGEQFLTGLRLRQRGNEGSVQTLLLRANRYGNNTLLRFIGMVTFALSVLLPGQTRGLPSPDVIIGSTVHPLAAWAALRLARRRHVPFIFEIRDVWPETLVDLGKVRESHILVKLNRRLFHHLCRCAALVLAPLPGIRKYLDDIGLPDKPFLWISNGIDAIGVPEPEDLVSATDVERPYRFMYLGSHGNANALSGILAAFDAARMAAAPSSMTLTFVGSGPLKNQLMREATERGLGESVIFEDWVAEDQVQIKLRSADCLVINAHDMKIYAYGMSPNKLFQYMLAGRPIIAGFTNVFNSPVANADAGITVDGDDAAAMASAMLSMQALSPAEATAMGRRGFDHVRAEYSFSELAQKLARGLDVVMTADVSAETEERE